MPPKAEGSEHVKAGIKELQPLVRTLTCTKGKQVTAEQDWKRRYDRERR